MRKPFVCGNWKMNTDRKSAVALAQGAAKTAGEVRGVEVGVCPPACYLEAVLGAVKGSALVVGGQNMHFEATGAFTGEVAGPMLKELGCHYVILGHSERRREFCESDELIAKKLRAVFTFSLRPILCVGETLIEREANQTMAVVKRQIVSALKDLPVDHACQAVIAYEPVWAIGTGRRALPHDAQEVHAFIRGLLREMYPILPLPNGSLAAPTPAESVRIIYGGSVTPDTVYEQMLQPDIDGSLVGGASLKADGFAKIITESARAKGL